jgi:copper chaperone
MPTFHIPAMSCGHCVATIRKTLMAADADATVDISLERKEVTIDSSHLNTDEIRAQLTDAGYPPA